MEEEKPDKSRIKTAFKVLAVAGGIALAGIVGNYDYFGNKHYRLHYAYKKQNPIYAQYNDERWKKISENCDLEHELNILNGGEGDFLSNATKENFIQNFRNEETKRVLENSFAQIEENIRKNISENNLNISELEKKEQDYLKLYPRNPLEKESIKRAYHPLYSLKLVFK